MDMFKNLFFFLLVPPAFGEFYMLDLILICGSIKGPLSEGVMVV